MKKEKGAYTLEAAIVMSAIIFIIIAIISGFLLLYQNAVMYYVATQAAQEGAVMWTDTSHDLDGFSVGADNQSKYYRLPELFNGGSADKKQKIKDWVNDKLKSMTPNAFVGSGKETVAVEFHNYVLFREVEVSITKEIDIPFKEVAQYFDEDMDIHVTAKAMVADPAEYVRNVDYVIELIKEGWDQISDKVGDLLKSKK